MRRCSSCSRVVRTLFQSTPIGKFRPQRIKMFPPRDKFSVRKQLGKQIDQRSTPSGHKTFCHQGKFVFRIIDEGKRSLVTATLGQTVSCIGQIDP
jgi:hypothetical protein